MDGSRKLNPAKSKVLRFTRPIRLSLDEETQPSYTPRSIGPADGDPALKAALVKQLRAKDDLIKQQTASLWQTELAYRKQLQERQNQLEAQISFYHERLRRQVQKNSQLQLQLDGMQHAPQLSYSEKSSSCLLTLLQ